MSRAPQEPIKGSRRIEFEAKNTDYVAAWWGWMLGYTLVAGAALACAYWPFRS